MSNNGFSSLVAVMKLIVVAAIVLVFSYGIFWLNQSGWYFIVAFLFVIVVLFSGVEKDDEEYGYTS